MFEQLAAFYTWGIPYVWFDIYWC